MVSQLLVDVPSPCQEESNQALEESVQANEYS
jgi:hypothetical protein